MGGWNILYALINFAMLAVGLYFVGKKLVAKILGGNRQRISDELSGAEKARTMAGQLDAELKKLADETGAQCGDVLLKAEEKIKDNGAAIEAKAKALGESEAEDERREAESLTRQALREIKAENVVGLMADTETLLRDDKYNDARRALEESFAARVEPLLKLTVADEARLRWGEKLTVTLSGADSAALEHERAVRAVVDKALGADNIAFDLKIRPALIGGLRLRVGDTVYDGSLRYMLRRLSDDISAEDVAVSDIGVYFTERFANADTSVGSFQTGRVVSLAEGICRIVGLSDVMAGEMVQFEGGLQGMIMDIESQQVSAVLLGSGEDIHSGATVRRTGRVMEVPVGEELIGRVVDALGKPIDGRGDIETRATRPVESPAPGIIARQPVSVPLQTGIMAIDTLVPIGRGQRELIIGDRQTGKTSIAIDAVINQKGKDVVCIYVAIGQKESTVAAIVEKLRSLGAMDYTIIVNAKASDPAPMLYIAPYTGAAMGEYLMYKGRHVLIIYDDLSKHAVAYRELSLLLHRPPGREAYPGDVFYLHSRLLERAACLNEANGGGSMTALPIVETQAGDISAYIPTNVISITDGQIFLDEDMFNSGNRPAINAGLSVSRVGGAAQPKAVKQFSSRLRMDLAQHRELEAFAKFGSDLDKATQDALNRGRKVTQLMVQKRYSPETTAEQVASVFAANEGFLDDLELEEILPFQKGLTAYAYEKAPELCRHIDGGGKLDDGQIASLRGLITEFKQEFGAA